MSRRSTLPAAFLLACTFAVAPLAAQQETGMMQHDTAMMDHGNMDHGSTDSGSMGPEATRMFMGAAGAKAAGDYEITEAGGKRQLRLTDDFAVAPAPDLYLVLARGDTPDEEALSLGELRGSPGGQTFDLPEAKDLSTYTKLLVWSKTEKRAVASAEWHADSAGMMHHM